MFTSLFEEGDPIISKSLKTPAHFIPLFEEDKGIFLGGRKARDEIFIRKNNIKLVISICELEDKIFLMPLPSDVEECNYTCKDSHTIQFSKIIYIFANTLDEKIDKLDGNCLIHCMQGISRSAGIVISYIMRKCNMSAKDAFRHVEIRRPGIMPNHSFINQLIDYEIQLNKDDVM
jgi:hypothetical protein